MGHLRHHAIVVTSWHETSVLRAWHIAFDLNMHPSPITPGHANGEKSFLVPPDGSKEGWAESNDGDLRREKFTQWMRKHDETLRWVEVQFADDNGVCAVVRSDDDEGKASL